MGKWSKKARERQAARMKAYWKGRKTKKVWDAETITESGKGYTISLNKTGSDTIAEKLNDIKAIVGEIQTMIGG